MTVEEMIAEADAYLSNSHGPPGHTDAVIAQAYLMRAELELRLQERRSVFAAEAVKKLDVSFERCSSNYSMPQVVPLAAADGFLIHLSNYDPRDRRGVAHHWGKVINWAMDVAKTYAEAGWKIRFKLGDLEPCRTAKEHAFWYGLNPFTDDNPTDKLIQEPVPYCCRCGVPRPVV